ncbi:MAG: DUF4214 domain-containing protein, partial [Aquihabitans sp.]
MQQLDLSLRRRGAPRRRAVAVALAVAGLVGVLAPSATAASQGSGPADPESEVFVLSGPEADATAAESDQRVRSGAPSVAGPGWQAALDVADGSQGVGVAWDGEQAGTVSVRGRSHQPASGQPEWTAWEALEGEPGEGPDVTTRTGTELLWFGAEGVDEVEIRVDEGELRGLALQAIRTPIDESTRADATAPAAAASSDGRPTIQPRSSWTSKGWVATSGCTPGPVAYPDGIGFAVVHHTVNSNTYSASEVPAILASIYAYDAGTLGWCDMAYHFIVDRFGRIWEGRSGGVTNPIIGTHAKGFNRGSVGVALLGQHQPGASPAAVSPTSAALTAVGQIVGWKLALHNVSPNTQVTTTSTGSSKYPAGAVVTVNRVSGHRNVQLTDCPGDLAYSQLATIRSVATSYQASMPAAPAALRPFRIPGTLVTQQYRDLLRRSPSQERYDSWSARVPGTTSPAALITTLVQSTDADSLLHGVTRLYRAYFLRIPDHGGFAYWTGKRASGMTLGRISDTFAQSSEFTRRYGSLSDEDFVRRVYQNVLGRAPDSGGLAYWTGRLRDGTSRGTVMANFSQSSEYVRKTEAGNEVIALYESLLQRAVSSSSYQAITADLADGDWTMTDVAQ